jgi:hypothetical protein
MSDGVPMMPGMTDHNQSTGRMPVDPKARIRVLLASPYAPMYKRALQKKGVTPVELLGRAPAFATNRARMYREMYRGVIGATYMSVADACGVSIYTVYRAITRLDRTTA